MKIFLLFLLFSPSLSDPIDFEVFIRCDRSIPYWCADLTVYEADDYRSAVLITQMFCTSDASKNFVYDPIYPYDGVSLQYEFNYQLRHNCTSNKKRACIQPDIAIDAPVDGRHSVPFYIKAYNTGSSKCRNVGMGPEQDA
ncbi:hypothetical protein GCK72_015808 [Caenorhabditis remanei]|uniref:Uncharacterized protein n=1 Tax=Caenorhabditis remanei TaxID=31234 RepID=A0A6A5GY76_CAERE|nr:hypothetical protein GCK72_015808 [Caenorhabditis remanei]KAF1759343.1 hypothetical protein GCK72_015808 [Caenorhabditis remanei]